jgi:hypothetical protein
MTSYTEFSKQFLVATFLQASVKDEILTSGEILAKYELTFNNGWVGRVLDDWRSRGFIRGRGTVGGENDQPILMNGAGFVEAERLIASGISVSEKLPAGIERIRTGSVYTYEGEVPKDFGGPGDIFVQFEPSEISSEAKSQEIPASDRLVSLNHNYSGYEEIRLGLTDVQASMREQNDLSVEPAERDRILNGLAAAEVLWNATQLKVLQIKVGILMAAEDAAKALVGTVKAVAAALLVDTIKAFVKNYAGIDLDHL